MMTREKISALIQQAIPDAEVSIHTPDNIHFDAVVISAQFANKNRVQQQQMVYQALQTYISNGEIHALALKTYTPDNRPN